MCLWRIDASTYWRQGNNSWWLLIVAHRTTQCQRHHDALRCGYYCIVSHSTFRQKYTSVTAYYSYSQAAMDTRWADCWLVGSESRLQYVIANQWTSRRSTPHIHCMISLWHGRRRKSTNWPSKWSCQSNRQINSAVSWQRLCLLSNTSTFKITT